MEVRPVTDYRPVIKKYFETDTDLLEKWHIRAPAELMECVNKTCRDLMEVKQFTFYELDDIGFFGKEEVYDLKFLTSFFIKPEYRNKETIAKFWQQVREIMGETFFSLVHPKNKPAIDFLKREGQLIATEDNHLIFEIQCQLPLQE